MQPTCHQLASILAEIQKLKVDFEVALSADDLDGARLIQQELENKVTNFHETCWLFPELPLEKLEEQYISQVQTLTRFGLLEILPSGEQVAKGIDDKLYNVPTLKQIVRELQSRPELRQKMKQGFTRLQITPFAIPLYKLTKALSKAILMHHKEGKLFATKFNQDDPDEALIPLELNEQAPLEYWLGYENSDVSGKLKYFPKNLDPKKHGGKTKAKFLRGKASFPGFLVTLVEPGQNIPDRDEGKTLNGRKQLEAMVSARGFLQTLLTDSQYRNERGITPEEWLVRFLVHLEETDQIIDDRASHGKNCFNLAGFFPEHGCVSEGYWSRRQQEAMLDYGDVAVYTTDSGTRSVVDL
ncbi:hypothetical protein EPO05_01740 [Patescibacteria group bacterium]|nr:MAG: hypothetical protein EPO05_01740 [Patescibacteria group bacterium]